MEITYPPGPTAVPENLTQATPAYKRHAWLAVAGLLLFVLLYFLLAGWFAWTAYRLLAGAISGGSGNAFWGGVVGVCAAFLAIFMLKALIFVKHGGQSDDIEISAQQQPALFAFLHRLADEAGAPRPHRVFVSPSVNAAVFYDLSVLNLIFPSKKNLLIGLGLVNVLSLGELKAVFAHEFGHFAQRSMAVGRWVYIAQQIAAHIVNKRDALDGFLRGLSNTDFRIAWVGWLLSLIVWSIRSLVETFFQVVVIAQRALSREMEMQADLVAVSLTGSDALIHALHRLQAADEAWERAVNFGHGELADKRAVEDLFAIQTRVIERIGDIRDDPVYGKVPPLPAQQAETHRVFKADFAQPPRMWSTHPFNHEREDNAKRTYVPAAIDDRSAWDLFDNPQQLRAQITAQVLGKTEDTTPMPTADALPAIDRQFGREAYKRDYRGAYLGRSVVRGIERAADLYGPAETASTAALDALYPESLAADLDQLRNLEQDKAKLEALQRGALTAPNGVIRHRGKSLEPRALPHEIELLSCEIDAINAKVNEHDRRCRTAHRAAAASLGNGWEAHLLGLAHLLHYAEHSAANLSDARGFVANTVHVVTAVRRVNDKGVQRVVSAANDVHAALAAVHQEADQVQLNPALSQQLKVTGWKESLGEFTLPAAHKDNINDWIKAIDSWVDAALAALYTLRLHTLEQLLGAEAQVARAFREQGRESTPIEPAPAPVQTPAQYTALLPGKERERQTQLGWWARFQNADGMGPTVARLAAALGIVGAVLGLGGGVGSAAIHIYNGLARPVEVHIGAKKFSVAAFGNASLDVEPKQHYAVQTRTADGKPIEAFDAYPETSFTRYIYNVAGASPLVEWTVIYGNAAPRPQRERGAPRWSTSTADILFQEPPASVRTKGGGASRDVLSGFGEQAPDRQLGFVPDAAEQAGLIGAHARWDPGNSRYILYWLSAASRSKGFDAIVAARLTENPIEIATLRYEQDHAQETGTPAHEAVCRRHQAMAAAATGNGDLHYLATRCIRDEAQRNQAFIDASSRWPDNGWLTYAAGYTLAEHERWPEALTRLDAARRAEPALATAAIMDIARIRRVQSPGTANLADITAGNEQLQLQLAIESGQGIQDGPVRAYFELARGQIEAALKIVKGTDSEARLLRLAAASDGADAGLAQRALALPHDKGMSASSLCATVGLAVRAKADVAPYAPMLRQHLREDDSQAILRLIEVLRAGGNADAAEKALGTIAPEARGYAYSIGLIVLGKSAPDAWRHKAKRLLFATERPYFG